MSFKPIVSQLPKVLVLGSMPGLKSLNVDEYYAHPHNSFWWIMSQILGFSIDLDYQSRVNLIANAGICVWDVLHDCQRKGSLDSNIVRTTEVPNDIVGFLATRPSITCVVFNGGAAKTIFHRHNVVDDLLPSLCQLPSTSPAFASMKKEQKYNRWHEVLAPHLDIN